MTNQPQGELLYIGDFTTEATLHVMQLLRTEAGDKWASPIFAGVMSDSQLLDIRSTLIAAIGRTIRMGEDPIPQACNLLKQEIGAAIATNLNEFCLVFDPEVAVHASSEMSSQGTTMLTLFRDAWGEAYKGFAVATSLSARLEPAPK